jgi:hypothetical protein
MRPPGYSPTSAAWAPTRLELPSIEGPLKVTVVPKAQGNRYLGGWKLRQVAPIKKR